MENSLRLLRCLRPLRTKFFPAIIHAMIETDQGTPFQEASRSGDDGILRFLEAVSAAVVPT